MLSKNVANSRKQEADAPYSTLAPGPPSPFPPMGGTRYETWDLGVFAAQKKPGTAECPRLSCPGVVQCCAYDAPLAARREAFEFQHCPL